MRLKRLFITIICICTLILNIPIVSSQSKYCHTYYEEVASGDFLIYKHNFTAIFVEEYVPYLSFSIYSNESVNIYWVNHTGFVEFTGSNSTQDISINNIEVQKNCTLNGEPWTSLHEYIYFYNSLIGYTIIINPSLSSADLEIDFCEYMWYEYVRVQLSWYWYLIVGIFLSILLSTGIYLYKRKRPSEG